jgi:hypothetical protein
MFGFKPPMYYAKSDVVQPDKMLMVKGSGPPLWTPKYVVIHPSRERWFQVLAEQYGMEPICMNRPRLPELVNPYEAIKE